MDQVQVNDDINSIEHKKEVNKLLCDIERRVRIIRSARIEAAKRNKKKDDFYKTILILYTIIITVLSVRFGVTTISGQDSNLSINLLASSVYLTLLTMYISQKNYAEKVTKYQSNYMELTRLQSEIQGVITLDNSAEINNKYYNDFTNRYASLLIQSDNHEDIDYHRAIIREEKDKKDKCILAEIEVKKYKRVEFFKRSIVMFSLPLLFILITIIEEYA